MNRAVKNILKISFSKIRVFVLFLGAMALGCEQGTGPETSCEKAYHEVCKQACDCSEDCRYEVDGIIITHPSYTDCHTSWRRAVCEQEIEWDFWPCIQGLRASPPVCEVYLGENIIALPEPSCSPVADPETWW